MRPKKPSFFLLMAIALAAAFSATPALSNDGLTGAMAGSEYYKVHPRFNPHPVENRNWTVSRFGPVGIGVDLTAPVFTMKVRNVEPGSPAEGRPSAASGRWRSDRR